MIKEELTARGREALLHVRELHDELENLQDGLRELKLLSISVSSPKMDGMPHAQSAGDARAQTLARIESQEAKIARTSAKLARAQAKARREIKELTGAFKAFCDAYYINGNTFRLSQAMSGREERQCKNYMALVKNGE